MPMYRLTRNFFDEGGELHTRGAVMAFGEGKQPSSAVEIGKDDVKKLKDAAKDPEADPEFFDSELDLNNVEGKALAELTKGKK